MPRRIILKTGLPPGDLCTLTAAIYSLHAAYPGQFLTDVRTDSPALFLHNPQITPLDPQRARTIEMHYTQLLNRCNQVPERFLAGYCRHLGKQVGLPLELQTNRPHLYLSDEERSAAPAADGVDLSPGYWLISAGVKDDFTLKQWPLEYYQEVIDHFRGRIQFVQIGSAEHDHPPLSHVVNLVGRTDLRQLICLVYHSQGGLGPITLLQHLCAAFEKPYVALLGGREPVSWTQYPIQSTLHTLGKLPCCRTQACWRSRTVRLDDGSENDNSTCESPILGMQRPVGKCMAIIKPIDVIRAIESCFEGGAFDYIFDYIDVGDGAGARDGQTAMLLSEANARRQMEIAASEIGDYPGGFEGGGIVIPAGGVRYFPCAWVNLKMLRHLGCTLPVELWHLGPGEMTDPMRRLVEPLGATCIDALKVRTRHSCRILNGWELKPYALLHSRFREAILLDADNFPLVDPSFLFDTPQYHQHGSIFWPDRGRMDASRDVWRLTGVPYRDEPEFETGQIVLDKQRCWRPLLLTMWLNEHSDFWYRHVHGDKETFHLAWRKLGVEWAMPDKGVVELPGVMCQHDFGGRRVFQHRGDAKWTLAGDNPRVPGFIAEDLALAFLDELRGGWSGVPVHSMASGA